MTAPSVVQNKPNISFTTGTSNTTSFTSAVAAGDAIVVLIVSNTGGQTTTSVSDNLNSGNYVKAVANTTGDRGGEVSIFVMLKSVAGSPTITIVTSSTANIDVALAEVSDVNFIGPTNTQSSLTGSTMSSGSVTNTMQPCITFGVFVCGGNFSAAQGGSTAIAMVSNGAVFQVLSAGGAFNPSATETSGTGWDGATLSLYEVSPMPASFPDATLPKARTALEPGWESLAPRVLIAPTEAYWSYPDRMQQPHRLALEPAVFTPPPVVAARLSDAAPIEAHTSFPDRLVRATTGPDYWTTVGAPERTQVYADQDFPDRVLRAKTGPDAWTLAGTPERTQVYNDRDFPDRVLRAKTAPDWSPTVGAPERTAPYADQDFPDRTMRAKTGPDYFTPQDLPITVVTVPTQFPASYPDTVRLPARGAPDWAAGGFIDAIDVQGADWSYPDQVLLPKRAPDVWGIWSFQALTVAPKEGYWSHPDRLVRPTTAPDGWTTVGAPERTAPYSDQDFPDRVPRARVGAPDERTLWPVPIPNAPAPVEGYWSYPDFVLRARVGAPDWRSINPLPLVNPTLAWWSYPDRVLRATTAPDAWEVPPKPERTQVYTDQDFPDRVRGQPFPPPEQQPVAALPPAPDERLPVGWASYPDRVLRATTAPDLAVLAPPASSTPAAWASYPDTVRGRPFLTIEQMVSTLWPQPIATPQTPAWYPDTVRGPLPRQGWDQAWQPHTTIPVLPNMVIWLGPKPIVVPVLAGAVIAPLLGKPAV